MYMSQSQKVGYKRYVVVHAWWGKGNRLWMPVDTQASLLDLTVHV